MAKGDAAQWRVEPGTKVHLGKIDTRSTDGAPGGKASTEAAMDELLHDLQGLQERLYADGGQSLLVVLQAIDAGGKDGTIKHVFRGLNPAGCRVVSFKVPSEEERNHDFLWRVHAKAPAKGEVVVFNRSHYEDVLVVRVHDIVPDDVWRPRYEFINDFEANLAASGTRIVKLYLHISKEEQAERFRARLDDPSKQWKFRKGDLDERAKWDDYVAAFEEAITRTSTDCAPWYVVPADRKWYRNWAVSRILIETLEDMDPQYPPAEDLTGVVIT
ncbi:MAG: Polyphosphate kinase 2 [uncultured Acidimicrobiales bacterium]|uniref:Polyphosphate kinase 2 n=1 Tax=uncultured Acidimicrobiales bacterium TaxID=310071 RepID=A0A6J4IM61_9ACTN|nr:MAG: Polyphosphate kinase 2 [uncultured Acidimicrobiales bacterium]